MKSKFLEEMDDDASLKKRDVKWFMKNIHGVKIYTGSIPRRQNLHGHKDTERNKIHGIEIHGAESAHRDSVAKWQMGEMGETKGSRDIFCHWKQWCDV